MTQDASLPKKILVCYLSLHSAFHFEISYADSVPKIVHIKNHPVSQEHIEKEFKKRKALNMRASLVRDRRYQVRRSATRTANKGRRVTDFI